MAIVSEQSAHRPPPSAAISIGPLAWELKSSRLSDRDRERPSGNSTIPPIQGRERTQFGMTARTAACQRVSLVTSKSSQVVFM